jgi:hypothetical protein
MYSSQLYHRIVQSAKAKNREKGNSHYYEAHHIIPKCLGGSGEVYQWKSHDNIVLLTPKEHFVCHKLLCQMYPDNQKLAYALWRLCNQVNKYQSNRLQISAREYMQAKELCSIVTSKRLKGVPKTTQHKEALSKAISAAHNTPEIREQKRLRQLGKVQTAETRLKQSKAHRKPVIDTRTGLEYDSIKTAAEQIGISLQTVRNYLQKNIISYKKLEVL